LLALDEHARTERWPASLDERDPVTGVPIVLAIDDHGGLQLRAGEPGDEIELEVPTPSR
jgi:hypothetical protein